MDLESLFGLRGRTAIVTGSSRGLGLVLARGLAEAGAKVVLNGRNEESLRAAAEGLRAAGLDADTAPFDVTDETAVEQAVQTIERRAGPIDVLVNNAGVNLRGQFVEMDTKTWSEVLNTNLTGAMFVARVVARRMIPRKAGKIINICSLTSERARANVSPYAVSKAGVKMLTQALAVELGPHNIQVNGIGPGYFKTDMTRQLSEDPQFDRWVLANTPMGRWGDPHELVGCAVFLASDASSFVNGQVVYVDGGWLAMM